MTDNNRLEEIEARLSKATPGPWFEQFVQLVPGRGEGEWIVDSEPNFICSTHSMDERCRHDAEFIAHSPADVAYLLAELRKAQDGLAAVSRIVNQPDWEGFPPFRVDAEPIRAAVADATGGGDS